MTPRLKNSIKELYETFAKYHSNTTMNGSSNYDNLEKWNKELFSKPLGELDAADLSRFTGKAITTWGNINDYKHFLPRIFELTAELRTPYEIWIAFDKLAIAQWNTWPKNEQNTIHAFMLDLWESILNDDSDKAEWEFNEYFSAIANFYPNFTDLLNAWTKFESKAAIKHLAMYLIGEQAAIFDKMKIPGLHDKTENVDEFISWVLSDKILNIIQQKYYTFEKERIAENISWAEQIVTTQRKSKNYKL